MRWDRIQGFRDQHERKVRHRAISELRNAT
jgi:hypothetical protein